MSIFGDIMSKIFHSSPSPAPASAQPQKSPSPAPKAAPAPTQTAGSAPKNPNTQPVDVEKVLTDLAAKKGGGGNWQTSIVDLLKLLDLDSSLAARKQLGQELGVHAGADGSAEQNIALQKAVWAKLAANGGKLPASFHH